MSVTERAGVRDDIRRTVLDLAPVPRAPIDSETSLIVDLGYDSLGLIELAALLEQQFGLPPASEDDVAGVETVGDVEELVLAAAVPAPAAESFGQLLAARAHAAPDQLAFTFLRDGEFDEDSVTNAELHRRAQAYAAALRERVPVGGRALLLFPPGIDYVAAVFACFQAGVVGVSAAPPHPKRLQRTLPRLLAIAADAAVEGVLTTEPIRQAAAPLLSAGPLASAAWLAVDAEADGALEPHRPQPGEVAFLQYTSGSTADPRGVMLTHDNLLDNSRCIARAFGHGPQSRGFIWLPPYHDMGLIGGILQPVFVGFPCVLTSPISIIRRPARWLEGVARHRATTSGGPNFAYKLCADKVTDGELDGLDLSCWDVAFNGAEPIRAATLDAFAARVDRCGFRREAFVPCYGLAEATLMVTCADRDAPPTTRAVDAQALEAGSVRPAAGRGAAATLVGSGRADLEHDVVIVDPEARTRKPPGEVGEVWVAGRSVAAGYWRREQETAATFRATMADGDGAYLRTGDLGAVADGELFVVGRLKELLIVNGRNLHPHDIEDSAERAHPRLRAGASATFAVQVGGMTRVAMVLEVSPGDEDELADVISAVRRRIAHDLDVQLVEVALCAPGDVPKTTSGKIQRSLCGRQLAAGELQVHAHWRMADGA